MSQLPVEDYTVIIFLARKTLCTFSSFKIANVVLMLLTYETLLKHGPGSVCRIIRCQEPMWSSRWGTLSPSLVLAFRLGFLRDFHQLSFMKCQRNKTKTGQSSTCYVITSFSSYHCMHLIQDRILILT
jgi:hypothetical protein